MNAAEARAGRAPVQADMRTGAVAPRSCCLDEAAVRLRAVAHVRGGWLEQQFASCHTMIVVTSGEGKLLADRRYRAIYGGSVHVCLPDHTFGTEDCSPDAEMYVFYFDVYRAAEAAGRQRLAAVKDAELFDSPALRVHAPERLAALCAKVYGQWGAGEKLAPFRCQLDFQELLYWIAGHNSAKPEHSLSALEYARQYMEEHYSENLTIDQLARLATLSPKYFVDLFKRKYGVSAMEYVTGLRIQQAKRLLSSGQMRLRDVALQVGYADELYFSRKFKQRAGVSPTVYTASRKRKIVAYTGEAVGQLLPLHIVPYAAALHPKWTEYYYRHHRDDIPVHLSAYRYNEDWRANMTLLHELDGPLEAVIAGADISDEERRELERIAPVHYIQTEEPDWRSQLLRLAAELGESGEARQWLQWYERRAHAARELLRPLHGQSVVVVRKLGADMFIHCNRNMADVLYGDLQLRPAWRDKSDVYDFPVTAEQLGELGADVMLMLVRQDSDTLKHWRELQQDESWQAIGAVGRGRALRLTSDPWREYSSHAHLRMLEQAAELLSGKHP